MTEVYFKSHALVCKKCGNKPEIIIETSLCSKTSTEKYRAVCWSCKWTDGENGNKTILCKTPERALKVWNKEFGVKEKIIMSNLWSPVKTYNKGNKNVK